jgi:MFS family permease
MPIIGRLGDMVGRKPIFVIGFAIFALGSLLCGLAPNIFWLIGFRFGVIRRYIGTNQPERPFQPDIG